MITRGISQSRVYTSIQSWPHKVLTSLQKQGSHKNNENKISNGQPDQSLSCDIWPKPRLQVSHFDCKVCLIQTTKERLPGVVCWTSAHTPWQTQPVKTQTLYQPANSAYFSRGWFSRTCHKICKHPHRHLVIKWSSYWLFAPKTKAETKCSQDDRVSTSSPSTNRHTKDSVEILTTGTPCALEIADSNAELKTQTQLAKSTCRPSHILDKQLLA